MPSKMERLEARITKEEKLLFQKAAELEGRTVTDFVVSAAREAAMKKVQYGQLLSLTARDQELFVRTVLNADKPNARLREAAIRYGKLAAKGK